MDSVKVPNELFTAASIGTFAGAAAGVWVLTNVFRVLFKRDSVIVGFIVSLVISFVGAYAAQALNGLVQIFLVFLNGCLLFLTAAGVQGFANGAAQGQPVGGTTLQGGKNVSVKFLTPWFKSRRDSE